MRGDHGAPLSLSRPGGRRRRDPRLRGRGCARLRHAVAVSAGPAAHRLSAGRRPVAREPRGAGADALRRDRRHPDRPCPRQGADSRGLVCGRAAADGRRRAARAARGAPAHLRGIVGGEGRRARAASRFGGADRARVSVVARGHRSARRFPALSNLHEDALSRPRRPVDRRPPRARPALVRGGDGQGARPGLWTLVPPRGRPRRDVCPRCAVRAVLAAQSPAAAGVVPRRGAWGAPRLAVRLIGWSANVSETTDPRNVDATLQAVRLQLFRENIGGALELVQAAHAANPDPRYAEQAAKINGWLSHLDSREAYLAAQEAQYRRLRWRAGLKLLEKHIRILLGRKTRKMVERRGRDPEFVELEREIAAVAPRRVLDDGCGEGAVAMDVAVRHA